MNKDLSESSENPSSGRQTKRVEVFEYCDIIFKAVDLFSFPVDNFKKYKKKTIPNISILQIQNMSS